MSSAQPGLGGGYAVAAQDRAQCFFVILGWGFEGTWRSSWEKIDKVGLFGEQKGFRLRQRRAIP